MKTNRKLNTLSRRNLLALSGATAATAALSGACSNRSRAREDVAADFIVRDANIITQDPINPYAEALAVKNGLIQAAGRNDEINNLRGSSTLVLSANGKTIIPGLNDSHTHPTRAGRFYSAELRWDGVRSLKRGLQMIREASANTPPGQWVRVVGGWSPFQFEERRLPTPAELTEVAPNTPVYVLFLYSQGYLNAAAVRARGLNAQSRAPIGTRYEFTEDGGCILHAEPNPDLLYAGVGALPPLSHEDQINSTKHYYRELNRFGLTSVIDAGGGGHKFPIDYKGSDSLAQADELSVRISKYLFPQNKGQELAEFQQWTSEWETGVNRAQHIMNSYVLMGGGEFLVWAAGDYENFLADRPDITTRENWRPQLLGVTRHLLQERWPLRIHATYDQSMNHILDVFEEAHALEIREGRLGFDGIRWAFDHGETVKPPTLQRIKALGGGMAMQARMAYAGEYFKDRYGEHATLDAPPFRDVIDAGLPLGLGSDSTRVASYNPWNTLFWATTGRSIGGTSLHSARNQLSREEALYHHTVGSAWFSQEEAVKGRIKPGQFADFAILNGPYLQVSDEDLMGIEADLTVMNGQIVWGQAEFEGLAYEVPDISPAWSPVRLFGGYQSD